MFLHFSKKLLYFLLQGKNIYRKVRILEKWSNEDDLTDQFSNAKFALMVNRKPLVSISSRNISLRILQSSGLSFLL